MEKEKLLKELKEEFLKLQKDLGFKTSFDDLDNIFFVSDFILEKGFVSDRHFSRQLCWRISETYSSWVHSLYELVFPNPQNLITLTESKVFSPEEKENINKIIKKIMSLVRRNNLIGISQNKKMEAEFIDNSYILFQSELLPVLINITTKLKDNWDN